MIPGGELNLKTAYSNFRVADVGDWRTLYFIKPDGRESVASRVHIREPQRLEVPYMQHMVLAQLVAPKAEQGLIIGTGGGSMIHFLQQHYSAMKLDSVDIDPVVTGIATTWFGVVESSRLALHTADGYDFIRATDSSQYDVVYLDAFVKPNAETDASGIPLHLKTLTFFEEIKRILGVSGVVVFNLHENDQSKKDLQSIRETFSHVRVLRVPKSTNLIVIATGKPLPGKEALEHRAVELGLPWLHVLVRQWDSSPVQ